MDNFLNGTPYSTGSSRIRFGTTPPSSPAPDPPPRSPAPSDPLPVEPAPLPNKKKPGPLSTLALGVLIGGIGGYGLHYLPRSSSQGISSASPASSPISLQEAEVQLIQYYLEKAHVTVSFFEAQKPDLLAGLKDINLEVEVIMAANRAEEALHRLQGAAIALDPPEPPTSPQVAALHQYLYAAFHIQETLRIVDPSLHKVLQEKLGVFKQGQGKVAAIQYLEALHQASELPLSSRWGIDPESVRLEEQSPY